MARYSGRKGLVYMSPSGTGTAVSVIALSKWSLSMARDKVDVTAFGDTNKQYVFGFADISGALSGFWDDTSDALYDGSGSADGVKLYLYPSSDALTKYWYGPAWVDFSIDVDGSGAATVSSSIAGAGTWGQY